MSVVFYVGGDENLVTTPIRHRLRAVDAFYRKSFRKVYLSFALAVSSRVAT